jgi:hypothetical protein
MFRVLVGVFHFDRVAGKLRLAASHEVALILFGVGCPQFNTCAAVAGYHSSGMTFGTPIRPFLLQRLHPALRRSMCLIKYRR